MELVELTLEIVKNMIFTNYNTYFTLRTLKKDFLKERNHKKTMSDNEKKELNSLGMRLGKQITKLREAGIVERYSQNTFRIIKH